MTHKTLNDLEVGDDVFVVHQNDRYRNNKGIERKKETLKVSKIGRIYTHLEGWKDLKFYRTTGVSAHKDCNARSNGMGFDAYLCESDFLQEEYNEKEQRRLHKRLCRESFGIIEISPTAVAAIHAILDKEEAKP